MNLETAVKVTSIRPKSPAIDGAFLDSPALQLQELDYQAHGHKISPQDLDEQEQNLLQSLLKSSFKSKVYKKAADLLSRNPNPNNHSSGIQFSSMPAALAESSSRPLRDVTLQQPSKPSNTVQSLLYRLETQPKSDKVLITRSTLADIQSKLADTTKKEKETSMTNELLSKNLEDIKIRYEQGNQSHASEKKRLEQAIKELKASLLAAKQAASIYTSRQLEKIKTEKRQLELDLYKERIATKQLQAQVHAERDQKQAQHSQIIALVKSNQRLKKMINALSMQDSV